MNDFVYDLDNDNRDELIVVTGGNNVLIFDELEKPKVDYFVKKVSFPKPFTTYSHYFNFTVCSKGVQILPLNISVEIYNNATNLKSFFQFLEQYINANSCKTYKIYYTPYKFGSINITVELYVNDSNVKNNIFKIKKDVEHDFVSLKIVNSSFQFGKSNKADFIFWDLNDDLKDGYESVNISQKLNCSYIKVDYNDDKAVDYLFDCLDYPTYLLVDPLNKITGNFSLVNDDAKFYVGVINSTHFSVILPWKNYTGYVKEYGKDENNLNVIYVDYNLDNTNDFLVYPWAINSKTLTDYKVIGQNLRLGEPTIDVSVNYNGKANVFTQTFSLPLYYKGLFNESEKFRLKLLDDNFYVNVSNGGISIPLSYTPYNSFNLLSLTYELNKNSFHGNLIEIEDKKDYNKSDNSIKLRFCDLSIKKISLLTNPPYFDLRLIILVIKLSMY